MKNEKIKIIWAINPFEAGNEIQLNIGHFLNKLSQKNFIEIIPLYISEFPVQYKRGTPDDYRNFVELKINSVLKNFPKLFFSKPVILTKEFISLTDSIKRLDYYAKKINANFIIVGTHGRKGFQRFFLGSFAETLLLNSKHSILTVGEKVKLKGSLNNIFYATNLENSSQIILKKVISFAKIFSTKITLFHALRIFFQEMAPYGALEFGYAWTLSKNYISDQEEIEKRKINKLATQIKKENLKIKTIISQPSTNTAETIVQQATKNNASIIALATYSGKMETALLGSTARQVVRSAPCPVLVLHLKN